MTNHSKLRAALACGVLFIGTGCMTSAQHRAEMAVLGHAAQDMAAEDLAWAAAISHQPGATPLPDLSTAPPTAQAAWYQAHKDRYDQFEAVLAGPTPAVPAVTPTTGP